MAQRLEAPKRMISDKNSWKLDIIIRFILYIIIGKAGEGRGGGDTYFSRVPACNHDRI